MAIKFSNNAVTTLSAGISAGVTSFQVASSSGFPTLGGSDWTYVTVDSEVVKITAISGTTFTCDATSSSHSNGDNVELRMTAELLDDFATDTESLPLAGGTMTGNIAFGDNVKANFGNDDDLQIYHDASNSYIDDAGTGDLNIRGSNDVYIQKYTGENMARFRIDDSVYLYYNNIKKFETTSTGIDVTGTVTADGLTVGSASGVFPSEAIEVRGNGGTSGYHNGFGLGSGNNQFRIFADDTNNTTGSIKFDIRNRDRILIEDSGDISFYEDTGTTPKFFWDASAESLGIGTSSPAANLDVEGTGHIQRLKSTSANGGYASLLLGASGANIGAFGSAFQTEGGAVADLNIRAESNLTFNAGGAAERLRIDSTGKVGIGTNSPTALLDARGNFAVGTATGIARIRRNTVYGSNGISIQGNATDTISDTNAGASVYVGGGPLTDTYEGNIILTAYGATTSSNRNQIIFKNRSGTDTVTERMRIDSSGNVGIGTSSPSLSGFGSSTYGIDIDQTNNAAIRIDGNAADSLYLVSGSGKHWLYGKGAVPMTFSTNGVERMLIDSSGNVGIGTSSPDGVLDVEGTIALAGSKAGVIFNSTVTPANNNTGSIGLVSGTINAPASANANSKISGLRVAPTTSGSFNGAAEIAGLKVETFNGQSASIATGLSIDAPTGGDVNYAAILNGGNVGIGTSSPSSQLHVQAGNGATATLNLNNGDGNGILSQLNLGYTADPDHGNIKYTGDMMFYNAGNTERIRITSSGNVGIGTSSPVNNANRSTLALQGAWGGQLDIMVGSTVHAQFGTDNFSSGLSARIQSQDGITFKIATGEGMRIDSSGNVGIGITAHQASATSGNGGAWIGSPTGIHVIAKNGAVVQYLNRIGTDGAVTEFRKDGTTVGSIGAISGDLTIGTGDTGLRFQDGANNLIPINSTNGVGRDNAIDLGDSGQRFKDLYLSGGAYIGGTVAANKLDDYEEGTWSPTPSRETSAPTLGTYTSRSGSYIKIGNVVWINCYFRMDAISGGSGSWTITNLPFEPLTGGNNTAQSLFANYNYINGTDQTASNGNVCRWQANNTAYFTEYSTTSETDQTSSVFLKGFTGCYRTS